MINLALGLILGYIGLFILISLFSISYVIIVSVVTDARNFFKR